VDEEKVLNWFTARKLRGAKALVEELESGEANFTIPAETQALAIGDCAIVGMPGEIFVKIGMAAVERSPFARTIAISHANGAVGYVPTADQVPLGGYEIDRARASRYGVYIARDSDQVLIDSASASLQKCYDALHR
jgi:neutral ceramidase